MPVKVRRINGLPRLVEAETGRIARNENGKARDGGPAHIRKYGGGNVVRQSRAMNRAWRLKYGD